MGRIRRQKQFALYLASVAISITLTGREALAQTPTPAKNGGLTVGGSLRVREEFWDWFKPATGNFQNRYAFTGATLRVGVKKNIAGTDGQFELESPLLLSLPKNAVAPAPQGALGLGGLYRTVNGAQNGSLFIKQAYLQRGLGGGQSLRAGRFEFGEGLETVPANPSLAWVKRERVSQRLIGPFAWPHVGRSFDGVLYARNRGGWNLTGVAAYPTQGVFDLDGGNTITAVRFGYVAATFPDYRNPKNYGEWRGFLLGYTDTRDVTKTDNSTVKDRDDIKLWTVGGHVLRGGQTAGGSWDALGWAAFQFGDWGRKDQSGYSFAVEGGYRFGRGDRSPWLRGGYSVVSGDGNPGDGKHNTFYAPISTPRLYARTPYYTPANLRDGFVQVLWKPQSRLSLRADYHWLSLDKAQDLWYVADGPFQTRPLFGLVGRPSGGKTRLGDLADVSVDFAITPKDAVSLYYGWMTGGSVVKSIYPTDTRGSFAYVEYLRKF